MHGFFIVLADRQRFVAICGNFVIYCVLVAMCMGFAIGLADKPPSITICVSFSFIRIIL